MRRVAVWRAARCAAALYNNGQASLAARLFEPGLQGLERGEVDPEQACHALTWLGDTAPSEIIERLFPIAMDGIRAGGVPAAVATRALIRVAIGRRRPCGIELVDYVEPLISSGRLELAEALILTEEIGHNDTQAAHRLFRALRGYVLSAPTAHRPLRLVAAMQAAGLADEASALARELLGQVRLTALPANELAWLIAGCLEANDADGTALLTRQFVQRIKAGESDPRTSARVLRALLEANKVAEAADVLEAADGVGQLDELAADRVAGLIVAFSRRRSVGMIARLVPIVAAAVTAKEIRPRIAIGLVGRLVDDGFDAHASVILDALCDADERSLLGGDDRVALVAALDLGSREAARDRLVNTLVAEAEEADLAPRTVGRLLLAVCAVHHGPRIERVAGAFIQAIRSGRGNPLLWIEVLVKLTDTDPRIATRVLEAVVLASEAGWLREHTQTAHRLIRILLDQGDEAGAVAVARGSGLPMPQSRRSPSRPP